MKRSFYKSSLLIILSLFISTSSFAAGSKSLSAQKRSDFISAAKTYLGTPYVYGGTSRSGIDCSGLVYMAAKNSGIASLPRTSSAQYSYCTKVDKMSLEAGDLVFFAASGKVSHVGIFLGSNKFIHSASEGSKTGVIISTLSESYWKKHYYNGGRIISPSKNAVRTAASNAASMSGKLKLEVICAGGFNFFTPETMQPHMQDLYIQFGIKTSGFKFNPGIMIRTFVITPYVITDGSFENIFNNSEVCLPICFTFDFTPNFSLYGGIVANLKSSSDDSEGLVPVGMNKRVNTNLFPGIFGAEVRTPSVSISDSDLSLLLNVNYIHLTAQEGSLTFKEALSAGLSFNVGVCCAFDL